MKYSLLLLFLFFSSNLILAQDNPAYVLYNANGKKTSYKKMLKQLSEADILLFGEHHNNPITHWLQLEVTQDLQRSGPLVLGAEMFEADNQQQLDQYLDGRIDLTVLDSTARLWSNFETDYKPLVDLAKEEQLPFVATNIPRKYARQVYRAGFESLDTIPDAEKAWMAPLPIAYDPELPGYKKMLEMIPGHGGENLPKAQAVKDATMAHFILEHFREGALFIHYNGSYHSDNYEGILWYLKQKRPDLNYITITTVAQKNVKKLSPDNKNLADFIICVPDNMTTTY